MEIIVSAILFGSLGGCVRGLVGVSKAIISHRKINPFYLLSTVLIACIVGGVTGILVEGSIVVSILAGYAGSDLIEFMYKGKLLLTKTK